MSSAAPVELLSDLARVFEAQGVAWYVFGAQAVSTYGVPRMTADVDVTAQVEPQRLGHFLSAMESAGFALRVDNPKEFVARARVLPFWHRPSRMPVDVVIAGPGLEEVFLSRVRKVGLGGVSVPFISPSDLVVTKVLANRSKDIDDVRGILRQQRTTIDLHEIRSTLREVEEALGQSDLLPLLDRLVAEVDESAPTGKSPRRR